MAIGEVLLFRLSTKCLAILSITVDEEVNFNNGYHSEYLTLS